jgi:hypothetical protein
MLLILSRKETSQILAAFPPNFRMGGQGAKWSLRLEKLLMAEL